MAFYIKWKTNQKYQTVGTIPESNIKIVERGKSLTLTYKYMTADFPSLVQDLLVKWCMRAWKCFPRVSKMPTLTNSVIIKNTIILNTILYNWNIVESGV